MQKMLPSLYGKLEVNFQNDYKREMQLHLTPQYLETLSLARENIDETHDCCCYCGFKDGAYLEIHHLNHNHVDFSEGNLKLICTLCHRLQHLGWVGSNNLGKILYLPSINSGELEDQPTKLLLEPLNTIQRFFLMEQTMPVEERNRLRQQPLYGNIESFLNAFKQQSFTDSYEEKEQEKKIIKGEREYIETASAEEKAERTKQVEAARDARRKQKANQAAQTYFSNLHLLDLLHAIQETGTNEKQSFLAQQSASTNGRLTIWFNPSVFEPFEPNPVYSFEERMNYYKQLGYFNSKGLATIIHNLRSPNPLLN